MAKYIKNHIEYEAGVSLDLKEPVFCQLCRTPIHTLQAVSKDGSIHDYTVSFLCASCRPEAVKARQNDYRQGKTPEIDLDDNTQTDVMEFLQDLRARRDEDTQK